SPLAAATAVVAPEIFFAAAELLVLPEYCINGVVEDKVKVEKEEMGPSFGSVHAVVIGHGDCGYDDLISRKLARQALVCSHDKI
ncbi:hypothetical protein Tco_1301360, partial [Tanacetum coccineum]